jgi:hypothetical protein
MRRPHFPLLLLFLATLACGGPATPATTPQPQSQAATSSPSWAPQAPITIAIEYGIFGVADVYTPTGVTYAKPQLVFGIWGNLEPERGRWQWEPLDALIAEYQAAGFSGQQILLTAESPWASRVPAGLLTQLDSFPKDEHIADYENFVRSVVERYDGDGVDDMPGLIYPIHEYGIEREFTGYWPGSAEDYVRLLRIAYPVIHEADPDAVVMQAALLLIDIFDGGPTDPAEIERRWQVSRINRSLEENLLVIAACDAYDVLDFHSLGDYIEIPATTAWIREQLQSYGCGDVPIWIGDAFSMSGLVGYGAVPAHPTTAATRDQVIALLRSVADSADADHEVATAWLRAEMAIGLVRKIVVSAGEGIVGINIGNLEDWALGAAVADEALVPMMGSSMFMGMTDTTVTQDRPGGPLPYSGHMWSQARAPGQERPAFYALQLVMETVSEYSSIEKLELGEHVWAYRYETMNGPVWVLWLDDGELYLPGQARPGVSITLEISADQAALTLTPTVIGEVEPERFIIDAVDGEISFELGLTPVFIRTSP